MGQPPKKISNEVFVARDEIVTAGTGEMEFLKERVRDAERRRVRLCAHKDAADRLHEMFILLARETYIRPHKHPGKAESLHVIEGEADAVFFDDGGAVTRIVRLGDYPSGRTFYYRIDTPVYHTLLFRSPYLLFHEATLGPFRKEEAVFAPWAPDEADAEAAARYLEDLDRRLRASGP